MKFLSGFFSVSNIKVSFNNRVYKMKDVTETNGEMGLCYVILFGIKFLESDSGARVPQETAHLRREKAEGRRLEANLQTAFQLSREQAWTWRSELKANVAKLITGESGRWASGCLLFSQLFCKF